MNTILQKLLKTEFYISHELLLLIKGGLLNTGMSRMKTSNF
jgi:hypothetical protein